VASSSCEPEFDGCASGKLFSISLEYTGSSLPGSAKNPNADWNHLQGSGDTKYKGFVVKDNFPAEGSKTIENMPITVAKFDMASVMEESDLTVQNGKFLAVPGAVINLQRYKTNAAGAKKALKLPGTIKIKAGKTLVKFSTNCKSPVRIGDEFGPFRVVGFTNKAKKFSCPHSLQLVESLREAERIANREDETTVAALPNAKTEAAASASSDSDTDNTARTVAIVLGVIGFLVILAVAAAAMYTRRSKDGDMMADGGGVPLESSGNDGAFEVDLDTRRVRRIGAGQEADSNE